MGDRFIFWMIYPLAVIAVLWVGWAQPLRYRFMSPQEILEAESAPALRVEAAAAAAAPPTTPRGTPWMFDPKRGNQLERTPYGR